MDNGSGASALARGRQPIFLIGQPRSGTTLLQRLINSTGNALLCGEHLGLLRGVAQSYMEFFHHPRLRSLIRHQNLGVARAARAVQKLRDPRLFSALVNGLDMEYVLGVYRCFVRSVGNPCNVCTRWGFKEILYCTGRDFVVPMLRGLFPDAQFVFTVREPLKQVKSVVHAGWWHHTVEQAANLWVDQARAMLQYCHEMPKSAMLVRYEDLICRDELAVRELFGWLGLPFDGYQRRILFKVGKIGATPKRGKLPPAVQRTIVQRCLGPESRALYGY